MIEIDALSSEVMLFGEGNAPSRYSLNRITRGPAEVNPTMRVFRLAVQDPRQAIQKSPHLRPDAQGKLPEAF